jgi:glucose/arabinose dehydrogenase
VRDRLRAAAALGAAAVAAWAGAGCSDDPPAAVTPTAPDSPVRLRAVPVATGLSAPVQATTLPGEPGRLWVVEQTGRVLVRDGRATSVVADLRRQVSTGGERGLFSVAFHPDHPRDRRIYVHFTDPRGDTRVDELRRDGAGRARLVRTLLQVDQPYANHNGGNALFGPDRLLYLGLGDGGDAFDPEEHSQDLGSRLGKLLRLDVDRPGADWEMTAYGLRNPWRMSFDRRGRLFIGDVGQDRWEEVDVIDPAAGELLNLGWDVREGHEEREGGDPKGDGRLVDPVHVYAHDEGCSITGGVVVEDGGPPSLRGRYLFGDFCSGTVWSMSADDPGSATVRRESVDVPGLTSIDRGADGEILLSSAATGTVYRLDDRPR